MSTGPLRAGGRPGGDPVQGTRHRPPAVRCPYCHEGFADDLCSFCEGCRTLYHRSCANELGDCATLGCNTRIRTREELPLTGNTIGSFNPRPLLIVGLGLTGLPVFGLFEYFMLEAGHYAGALLLALPVLVMVIVACFPTITGGRRLGRIFIGR